MLLFITGTYGCFQKKFLHTIKIILQIQQPRTILVWCRLLSWKLLINSFSTRNCSNIIWNKFLTIKLLWKQFFMLIEPSQAIVLLCNYQPICYCYRYPISINLEQMLLSMPTSSANKQWKLTISPSIIKTRPYPKTCYLYTLIN